MLLEQLPLKAQGCSPIAEVWALLPGWGGCGSSGCPLAVP